MLTYRGRDRTGGRKKSEKSFLNVSCFIVLTRKYKHFTFFKNNKSKKRKLKHNDL